MLAAYDCPGEGLGAGWRSQAQVCSGEGILTKSVQDDKEQNNSMETGLPLLSMYICMCVYGVLKYACNCTMLGVSLYCLQSEFLAWGSLIEP